MARTSVCFVVTEILGSVKNGGIATATTHAALVLAQRGFDVEILYCGFEPELERVWSERYDDAGIRVRWLDRSLHAGPPMAADSYRLYHQLRASRPDIVVTQDWQGLAYCTVLARRAGELPGTRLVHICHGPTPWLQQANRRLDTDATSLAMARMEQTSAELSDCIVSPSRHLIDWMLEHGWQLPPERHVVPYFTEGHVASLDRPQHPRGEQPTLTELVFFGRLEERKGVAVFVDALNRLGPDRVAGLTVTFLGREATITADDVSRWLQPRVRAALLELRFEGDLDQAGARAYLSVPGRLALIPSLLDNSPNVIYECIEDRIPFLATDAGGNGELVLDDDRAGVLFAPTGAALAELLGTIVDAGVVPHPARAAFDGHASLAAWEEVLRPIEHAAAAPAARSDDEAVTVVIAHHDGERHLREAVDSVMAQDSPAAELLIVDDGSTDPASLKLLEELEAASWPVPLRVVRQENRYLGAARNTGMRESRTELVAFLDDDDVLRPGYVGALRRAIALPGAVAAVGTLLAVDADADGELGDPRLGVAWVWLDADPAIGPVWNAFGGAAMLVRRSVALEAGGFHERRGVGHEDWELLLRLSLAGHRIVHVPAPLYHYRIREGSMIRTTSQYGNMAPVFEAYRPYLPPSLHRWPEVLRGQHETLQRQGVELWSALQEIRRLNEELARRARWFEVKTRARPD